MSAASSQCPCSHFPYVGPSVDHSSSALKMKPFIGLMSPALASATSSSILESSNQQLRHGPANCHAGLRTNGRRPPNELFLPFSPLFLIPTSPSRTFRRSQLPAVHSSSWLRGGRRHGRGNDNSPTVHSSRRPTRSVLVSFSPTETAATKQWRQSPAVCGPVRECSRCPVHR